MNKKANWLSTNDRDFYGFHGAYHDGLAAIENYNDNLAVRQSLYPFEKSDFGTRHSAPIEEVGYHKIPNFFTSAEKKILSDMKRYIENLVETGDKIKRIDSNMALVGQPLLNIPNLYKILFNNKIIEIATAFFGCVPALTSVAVRKSFITDGGPISNQTFHRDYNSLAKHLKFAIYLHDVDVATGPFTYVEESNKRVPENWWGGHYFSDDFIKNMYGEEKIKLLTANFGDLLIANTRGFHKGTKPKSKERIAIHACYMIHPELTGPGHQREATEDNWFKMKRKDYESLTESEKPVADFLQKITE